MKVVLRASRIVLTGSLPADRVQTAPPVFLDALRKGIQDSLDALDAEVRAAAGQVQAAGWLSPEAKRTLDQLARGQACAIDSAAVDDQGIMRVVMPEAYHRFEGADISCQPQMRRLYRTRRPVLSTSFLSVEGVEAVDLEHPLLDSRGNLFGSISLLIKPEVLLGAVAERSSIPAGWELWVLETSGRFLYGSRRVAIGKNLLRDPRYQPFPSLRALGRRIARETEGAGAYEFAEPGETPVPRKAFWTTAALHGTSWRVLATCLSQTPAARPPDVEGEMPLHSVGWVP